MATNTRTRKNAASLEVCKNGRKWDLVENGKVIDSFKTKTEALNELEACKADVAPKRARKAAPAEPTLTIEAIAAMDKTERLQLAKAEATARKAWKSGGMVGDAPATPVLDFMESPFAKVAKAQRQPVVRTTDAEVEEFLREFMGNGNIPKASDIYAAVRAAGHKVGGARMTSLVAKVRKEVTAS